MPLVPLQKSGTKKNPSVILPSSKTPNKNSKERNKKLKREGIRFIHKVHTIRGRERQPRHNRASNV
jgi:hypothetical protein